VREGAAKSRAGARRRASSAADRGGMREWHHKQVELAAHELLQHLDELGA
jgi:hypothetical protein